VLRPALELTEIQQKIVDQLGSDPISVDALADASGLEVFAIMPQLTVLTLRGVIKRGNGQTYSRSLEN
jgi:predicted Rossmann fold nucleotide-binding protein DprA/Smf involved in DNA uptake